MPLTFPPFHALHRSTVNKGHHGMTTYVSLEVQVNGLVGLCSMNRPQKAWLPRAKK